MDYKIRKMTGKCGRCEREIGNGEAHFSTILLEEIEPVRRDWCIACFEAVERDPNVEFAYWKTRRTSGSQPRRPRSL